MTKSKKLKKKKRSLASPEAQGPSHS